MTAITFDTLKYAERLEAGGVPPQQAKAEAHALAEVLSSSEVASARDIERLEGKIELLRSDLNGKFTLLQWMLGLLLAGVALLRDTGSRQSGRRPAKVISAAGSVGGCQVLHLLKSSTVGPSSWQP